MKNDSLLASEFLAHGRSESCPIIDMHGHYGPFSGIYFPKPYAGQMLDTMDRAGVTAIVCSSHSTLVDQERGNREMAQVVRDHPGRFYGYRVINPNYPEAASREVTRFPEDPGFIGFKFHPDQHSYPITGDRYLPALEYAEEHRLILLTHSWGDSHYDGPKLVGTVAGTYPRVTFLMGHSGYGEWETAFAVAREHDNVYLELTAAYRVNGIITRMVREVGSHKVIFGTDQPWFDPHCCAGAICFSRISDDDRRNIFHRNAERMLARFRAQPREKI